MTLVTKLCDRDCLVKMVGEGTKAARSRLIRVYTAAMQVAGRKLLLCFLTDNLPPLQAAAVVSSLNWTRSVLDSVSSDANSAGIRCSGAPVAGRPPLLLAAWVR